MRQKRNDGTGWKSIEDHREIPLLVVAVGTRISLGLAVGAAVEEHRIESARAETLGDADSRCPVVGGTVQVNERCSAGR